MLMFDVYDHQMRTRIVHSSGIRAVSRRHAECLSASQRVHVVCVLPMISKDWTMALLHPVRSLPVQSTMS